MTKPRASSAVRSRSRWRRVGLLALTAVSVSSCGLESPFARTNHWDAGTKAEMSMTGPDSTFAIGDRIAVVLTSNPPIPANGVIVWKSNEVGDSQAPAETQVWTAGTALFEVRRATAQFQRIAVTAILDENIVAWHVWVGQKVAALDVFCGSFAAQVACDATPISIGGTQVIGSRAWDANTHPVTRMEYAMARGTVVSRDPAVVSTSTTQPNAAGSIVARAVGAGTTWVVMRIDGVADSVRFVVAP